jgi:hypothetical protein
MASWIEKLKSIFEEKNQGEEVAIVIKLTEREIYERIHKVIKRATTYSQYKTLELDKYIMRNIEKLIEELDNQKLITGATT